MPAGPGSRETDCRCSVANSVQNTQAALADHVIALTKAGEFAGHQAARTAFAFYCHRTAANDNKTTGLKRLHVMPGNVSPRLVAHSTGLSEPTVRKANAWLHERGFIEVTEAAGGKYRYLQDVAIKSYDTESEAVRRTELDRAARPKVARRGTKVRHLAVVRSIEREAQ